MLTVNEPEYLILDDTAYETTFTEKFKNRNNYSPPVMGEVYSHIPGVICSIDVEKGRNVVQGEGLLVLEAMKMRNEIVAPLSGRIKAVHITIGEMVPRGHLLVEIETE